MLICFSRAESLGTRLPFWCNSEPHQLALTVPLPPSLHPDPPPEITLAPENITAPEGTNVTFFCEGIGTLYIWMVDTILSPVALQLLNNETINAALLGSITSTLTATGSMLTLLASSEADGLVVKCSAGFDLFSNDRADSSPATLRVFGKCWFSSL